MNIILEVSDRKGKSALPVQIPKSGLRVGRAWDSDILITDKFVDANHLLISVGEHDELFIEDQNTQNGTLVGAEPVQTSAFSYSWGNPIHIGDTSLRLLEMNAEVAKAEPRSKWFSLMTYLQSWKSLLLIVVCTIVIQVFQKSISSRKSFDFSDALLEAVVIASAIFVWSLLVGGLSKLIRGHSNMRAHLALISIYIILTAISTFLVYILRFNLQSLETGELISNLISGLTILVLVFGVITYTSYLNEKYKWFWSILAMAVVSIMPYKDRLMRDEHERWVSGTKTERTMLPPTFLVRRPISIDDYFEQSASLFKEHK